MLDAEKKLSNESRRLIAGIMQLAPALTAFGNTNPTSYFRLVPHQEAPTNICWGDRNRSVLVRVPLGWTADCNMSAIANNSDESSALKPKTDDKQTIEIRSGDCSANIYLYIAGLAVAARLGFEMNDALKVAQDTYVDVNIHDESHKNRLATLSSLPTNCGESADALQSMREIFEAEGVFSTALIDGTIRSLKSYNDAETIAKAMRDSELMHQLVNTYFHCG